MKFPLNKIFGNFPTLFEHFCSFFPISPDLRTLTPFSPLPKIYERKGPQLDGKPDFNFQFLKNEFGLISSDLVQQGNFLSEHIPKGLKIYEHKSPVQTCGSISFCRIFSKPMRPCPLSNLLKPIFGLTPYVKFLFRANSETQPRLSPTPPLHHSDFCRGLNRPIFFAPLSDTNPNKICAVLFRHFCQFRHYPTIPASIGKLDRLVKV